MRTHPSGRKIPISGFAPTAVEANSGPTRRRRLEVVARMTAGFVLGYMLAIAVGMLGLPLILRSYLSVDAVLLGLMGSAMALTPLRLALWLALGASIAVSITVGYSPAIARQARSFVRRDPILDSTVDAIVVLSSGLSDDGTLDVQGLDRMLTGAALLRTEVSHSIVLTRLHTGRQGVTSDLDQQRVLALLPYVPRVLRIDSAGSTRDEAVKVAGLARDQGWKRLIVVTSPVHTRRACAAFERVGLSIICVPSVSRDVALYALEHRVDRLRAFQLWLYEMIASWKYRANGWI
jgi:uncharacterized SAM-binding protein YcdF (DUF218 family)